MDTKKEKIGTSVRPYDDSMWDRNSMYDRMPYVWDPDLNVEKVFRKVTGNIIKAYRCKIEEPIEVKYE
ncbi:MAG TPA: hypothetical protein VN258_07630 [Mobilitalea sp.]|nr:hypothetical protein [Mobilitalea sp.]